MKNKFTKSMSCILFAASIIACNPKKADEPVAPVVDAVQIKTDLQTMETAFADAMNANKSESIGYYADDATSYSQNKAPLTGKDAIHQNMNDEIASSPKGAKVAYKTNEVFPSADGDQVVEIGSYKVTDAADAVVSSGNYMAFFEKRDGKYICTRDMAVSDQPLPEKK